MAKEKETPVVPPAVDPDEEFFSKEGVTDPEERDAVRSRARVLRYAAWKTKQEDGAGGAPKSKKPWYKKD